MINFNQLQFFSFAVEHLSAIGESLSRRLITAQVHSLIKTVVNLTELIYDLVSVNRDPHSERFWVPIGWEWMNSIRLKTGINTGEAENRIHQDFKVCYKK